MIRHRDAERARILECGAHQVTRHHGVSVVAHRNGPCPDHFAEFRQLLALLAHGDAADRVHPRECRGLALRLDEPHRSLVVDHWVGVGHRTDPGETAGDRRHRSGGDRLAILLPGLAQVNVHVDQPGCHDETLCLDDPGTIGSAKIFSRAGHLPILQENVGDLVQPLRWIDDTTAAQENRRGHASPPALAQSGEPPASR